MMVHAVTAWEVPMESTFGDMATVGDFHPVVTAEQILVTAQADAGVADTHVTVTTTPVQGHPAEVQMQQAKRAKLLVVGSRGHGGSSRRCSARSASTWPPTPPARSSSSNPSPISTAEDPLLDADDPAPTSDPLLALQHDRSERTNGRGHVSDGDP
jgi:hypothetical protein